MLNRALIVAATCALAAGVVDLELGQPVEVTVLPGGPVKYRLWYTGHSALLFDLITKTGNTFGTGLELKVAPNNGTGRVMEASEWLSAFFGPQQYESPCFFEVNVSTHGKPAILHLVAAEAGVGASLPTWTNITTLNTQVFQGELYLEKDGAVTTSGFVLPVDAGVRAYTVTVGTVNYYGATSLIPTVEVGSSPAALKELKGLQFDAYNVTYFLVSMGFRRNSCPWLETNQDPHLYRCADGTECDDAKDPGCCKPHGGMVQCPAGLTMCSDPTACSGEHCCAADCADLGQYRRTCGGMFDIHVQAAATDAPPTPVPPTTPVPLDHDHTMPSVPLFVYVSTVGVLCIVIFFLFQYIRRLPRRRSFSLALSETSPHEAG